MYTLSINLKTGAELLAKSDYPEALINLTRVERHNQHCLVVLTATELTSYYFGSLKVKSVSLQPGTVESVAFV